MPLMYGIPNIIEATQSWVLRPAGSLGLDTGLLGIPPSFKHVTTSTQGIGASHSVTYADPHGDKPATDTATAITGGQATSTRVQRDGIRLFRWELVNTAAASAVGIGFRIDNVFMEMGTLPNAGTGYSPITSSIRNRTAVAVGVDADTVGFVVASRKPFTWFAMEISTSETGTPTHAVQYSQYGTTWTTVPTGAAYTDTLTRTATAWTTTNGLTSGPIQAFVWEPVADWEPSTTLMGGLLDGFYLLRVTTTANTTAALITGAEIGKLQIVKSVAQNGVYTHDLSAMTRGDADGIIAYFGTADGGNHVYAEWEPMTA